MINRSVIPQVPAQHYKTYAINAPRSTHTRPATCAEVECPAWINGWKTVVPGDSMQAAYIRARSGRHFTEVKQDAGIVEFLFFPEQPCFRAGEHRISLERPPIFSVRGGDFRGNPLQILPRRFARPEDWRDDFGEHQERIAEAHRRG